MQSCERVVMISTISTELIDMAEIIQQFRDKGLVAHVHNQVTGLLLYSDRYIFHCLESQHGEMDQLKRIMLSYPYQHNPQFIYDKTRVEPRFDSWSMVYVLTETRIQDFIHKQQWSKFNPYLLEGALLDEFMQLIYSYSDTHQSVYFTPHKLLTQDYQFIDQSFVQQKKSYGLAMIGLALIMGLIIYVLDYLGLMSHTNSSRW